MDNPMLLSIQVGLPAERGADKLSRRTWESGIFKEAVKGRIWLDKLNLDGDGQQDLENHGGYFRTVLAYSADHYPTWRAELAAFGLADLPYGAFGENFTISALDEETVCLGDVVKVGEATLQVTQPRLPCWKLARRWQLKDLTAKVDGRGWGGWYHRVLQTGYVQAGDLYQLIERPHPQFPVLRVNRLLMDVLKGHPVDIATCRQLAALEALTPSWRESFSSVDHGAA